MLCKVANIQQRERHSFSLIRMLTSQLGITITGAYSKGTKAKQAKRISDPGHSRWIYQDTPDRSDGLTRN